MSQGHVFLIRGDLRAIRCDAIGYSGNPESRPSRRWENELTGHQLGKGSPVDGQREVRRWSVSEGEPAAYIVPVAGMESTPIGWYIDALRVFLERATADLKTGDAVPKLAIPLFGASKGGQERAQGELLEKTLEQLWSFTRDHGVDIALVFDNDGGFDAAQSYRRRRGPDAWQGLTAELQQKADDLASLAAGGDLALFLGAGVSVAAGLPSWTKLLNELARSVLSDRQIEEARKLSPLDYAQLLAGLLPGKPLGERVIDEIQRHRRPSFAHTLLASLPVREMATTNYDTLLEKAAESAGKPVHVIPYKGAVSVAARDVRWLLKLHGSIEKPGDIVLSRQTFVQYEASRAALAGLFAGVLLTRHVMFVGSSFSDDNVLRIMDEVQRLGPAARVTGQSETPRLGTCLAIGLPSVQKMLWKGEFDWVDFGDPPTGGRTLEIFLDRMLFRTTSSASYLFDERFAGALSEEERTLRDHLDALLSHTQSLEHPVVGTLLRELGARLRWKSR